MLPTPMGASSRPFCSTSYPASSNSLGKAEDDPSVWVPVIHVSDLDEALGSWLSLGSTQAIVAI